MELSAHFYYFVGKKLPKLTGSFFRIEILLDERRLYLVLGLEGFSDSVQNGF